MATIACNTRTMAPTSAPISRVSHRLAPVLALVLCLLGLLPLGSHAQILGGQLTVYSSPVVYANPMYDSLALVEFPFVISRAELEFFQPDSTNTNIEGRVFAQVILQDDKGVALDSTNTYFSVLVASKEEAALADYRLFNKLVLKTKPGLYTAHLTVIDVVSKKSKDIFFGSFNVPPPSGDKLRLGGAFLAFKIQYVGNGDSAANVRMVRNGFLVLNNPIGVYGPKDSSAFLYAELYGLKTGPKLAKTYRLGYQVVDSASGVVRDYGFKVKEKPGKSAVISDAMDIAGLSTGRYDLRIIASDSSVGEADTVKVPLIVLAMPKPLALQPVTEQDTTDEWNTLSLQDKINCTHWLLTPDQRNVMDRLSDVGKENFLNQFWRENNVNRTSKILSADSRLAGSRAETVKRFLYANQRFSQNEKKTNGWNSDRGRVYIVYGPWDTHKEVATPRVGDPFIIWNYNSFKEGKVFVFQDVNGDNDYRLVHSNVQGEPYSKDWEDRLKGEMYDVE
jgi:GWxTD domain-containing protein